MQLNTPMRYNILLTFFDRDQNISCKLSSVFLMIKRLNRGIPEKKGLESFRHFSCMFIYKQSFKERLLAVQQSFLNVQNLKHMNIQHIAGKFKILFD